MHTSVSSFINLKKYKLSTTIHLHIASGTVHNKTNQLIVITLKKVLKYYLIKIDQDITRVKTLS